MFEIHLECGHKKWFTMKRLLPKVGSYLPCSRHATSTVSAVTKVLRGYVVECETCPPNPLLIKDRLADVSYVRRFGFAHLKKCPTHRVVVYIDGEKKGETYRVIKAPNITHQTEAGF